ncbi:MAG: methyltransferase domain-containing protein [Alphaproteobacteria bacterium]
MLQVHLGCGRRILPGYLNVDIAPGPGVDVVCDLRALPLADNSVDFFYSCANIEHFGRHEWRGLLVHWFGRLKCGGSLRLSTTDFAAVCAHYRDTETLHDLLGLVIGGQRDAHDWHGMVFDFDLLREGLEAAGFVRVRRYDWRDTDVGRLGLDDYSQAYLPHMDKTNGRLMALNVLADKP